MKLYPITLLATLALAFTGCRQDNPNSHDFENKVFVDAMSKPTTTYLRGIITEMTKTIKAGLAEPAVSQISLTYAVAPELVKVYNQAFYDKAVLLPEAYYEIPEFSATIAKGSVVSSAIEVNFKLLDLLDREMIYVLPVTLTEATNISVLERARTAYYVFRGAALINVAGNLTQNYLDVTWKNPGVVNNLSRLTIETLIRVKKFDRPMSTVIGVEGQFLVRIGDITIAPNQLQLATGAGNLPGDRNEALDLPVGKWVHIAVTYDNTLGGKAEIFVDGKSKISGTVHRKNVNLGISRPTNTESENARGFHIGYSYSNDRYLDGDIAELRIWNRVLTADEISAKNHFYYVEPTSDGLVAYWKFDEAAGQLVKDYTGNGNDATATMMLKWVPANLPESVETNL